MEGLQIHEFEHKQDMRVAMEGMNGQPLIRGPLQSPRSSFKVVAMGTCLDTVATTMTMVTTCLVSQGVGVYQMEIIKS